MNYDYVLVSDADCEIPIEWKDKYEIAILPMPYTLDGEETKFDLGKIGDMRHFYDRMRAGAVPTTAQANPEDFKQLLIPYLQNGLDAIYIGVSSALSGTVASANLAAAELVEMFPERRVIVVDSLAISVPMGILVKEAAIMRQAGKSMEQVRDWCEQNKQRPFAFFTVDDLKYLRRGGRISGAAAFFGTLLEVKPLLYISPEGKLVPCGKLKGRKNAVKKLAHLCLQYAQDIESQVIYLLSADSDEDAQMLAAMLKDIANPADVQIVDIGPVIGSHAGPGTLGIVFFANNREITLE